MRRSDFIRVETSAGEPVTRDGVTVVPEAQSILVRWPHGGLVYSRPAAVQVTRGDETERIPVVDITRLVQIGLLIWAGLFILFGLLIRRRAK